jgi:ADP-ribose pyrophosphatase
VTIERPEVIASRLIHKRWIGLRIDRLRYPSGNENDIDVVEHNGGVALLAIDNDGNLLLVRQYRHATGQIMLELPAGTIDGDEPPEVCAVRELQEETGYKPGNIEKLGGFWTAPGYCSEYLHVYLCTDLTESRLQGDEEAIDVERVSIEEALAMVADGRIEDAKTNGALLFYIQGNTSLQPLEK